MRSVALIAALAAALLSASAIQATGTSGQASGATGQAPGTTETAAPAQTSDLDTIVCKDIGPPTGSHLGGKRVCDTKRHWQQIQQDSQDALQKIQSTACVGGQACGG